MQFPTWLVSKIRKPLPVISIVVAMASLLIACGDTTNQGQTTSEDTTNQDQSTSISAYINTAMSIIAEQRQQSYAAVQQIYYLALHNAFQGCVDNSGNPIDYYGNAKSYYTSYVQYNFNGWLERLASEVQSGQPLNTSTDPTWLSDALMANYAFTTWESSVNDYFTNNSCQGQGGYLIATFPKGGIPLDLPDVSRVDPLSVESNLKQVSDAFGYLRQLLSQGSPSPQGGSVLPTSSLSDLLGAQAPVIRSNEWQDFCAVVQNSSC